jgi:uncharacterized membrane protein
MWSWFTFWLMLHIATVLVAFGPDFAFPFIAALVQKHPEHGAFATEVIHVVESKLTIPLAVIVPFEGLALIYSAHIQLWKSEWLIISIILYTATFFFALLIQLPNTSKMLRLLRAMPPGPPPPGAQPPAEVTALGRKLQLGGMYLALMVIILIVLMVWRPGNCYVGAC